MDKVALVIIYNHKFEKNVPILEDIYKGRFDNIYHLMPFYTGNQSNVIPVYENSFCFQGYVSQGYRQYFKQSYAHYVFVADDMLLNPVINQNNYKEFFLVDDETCFIPGFINLHETKGPVPWPRVGDAFYYNINLPGTEISNILPDYQTALSTFKKLGLEIAPLEFSQIWRAPQSWKDWIKMPKKHLMNYVKDKVLNKRHQLPYPAVGAYCDIFVISADTMPLFVQYCGVTAATKLFVEVALPTSLALSAKKISTEEQTSLKGAALWNPEDFKFLERYESNLDNLLNNFPENLMYIHPIKLSKWRIGD